MLSAYGEYIDVRKKDKRHTYKTINIHHFTAYLVKPHDMIAAIMTTKEKQIPDICNIIALGFQNTGTKDDIMHVLHELAENCTCNNVQTGTVLYVCYYYKYDFVTNSFLYACMFRY